jgi:hypothetical protein
VRGGDVLRPEVTMGKRKRSGPVFDSRDGLLDAAPDATLDLHGFTAIEVASAVRRFLETWQRRKPGALLHIITG